GEAEAQFAEFANLLLLVVQALQFVARLLQRIGGTAALRLDRLEWFGDLVQHVPDHLHRQIVSHPFPLRIAGGLVPAIPSIQGLPFHPSRTVPSGTPPRCRPSRFLLALEGFLAALRLEQKTG